MKCILLCAGYGTRLYPLTKNQPKALLNVANKPIIEHIINKIELIDEVDTIYIITNDRFYQNFSDWQKTFNSKKQVKIINDNTNSNENRLGAIGDLHFVITNENIQEDLLLISGDNLFEFSLLDMHAQFKNKKTNTIALYDVKKLEEAKRFGVVKLDDENKVIAFQEKPEFPESTLSSIGIYFYPKETLDLIKTYLREGNSPDMPGMLLEWLHKKSPVHGFVFDGKQKWFDIGSLESLEEANQVFQ